MDRDYKIIQAVLRNSFLFSELDAMEISNAAYDFEIVSLAPGENLYSENEPADFFYIAANGKVNESIGKGKRCRRIASYTVGDYFGMDCLYDGVRKSQVTAAGDVELLRLPKERMSALMEDHPGLNRAVKITQNSRKLARRKKFYWLDEDEAVYMITRKHEFFLYLRMVFPLALMVGIVWLVGWGVEETASLHRILGLAGTLVILGLSLWLWRDWGNDFYAVTSKRVLWIEKVILLYDSRQEAPLSTVLSSNVQSFFSLRLFIDYGTVNVKTYTGEIPMRRIRAPGDMVHFINGLGKRTGDLSKLNENKVMEVVIGERLGVVTNTPTQPKILRQPVSMSDDAIQSSSNLIMDFVKMRSVNGDRITYRKHWFVLLKKIWLQSLVFAGLIIVLYYLLQSANMNQVSGGIWSALVLFVLGAWVYQYIDWRNDVYVVTSEHIFDIERKPLGREDKKSALLENILSLEHSRVGIFGLLLNYGTVTINVGSEKFQFHNIFNPAQVQSEIFGRMSAHQQRKEEEEAAKDRDRVADWIAIYHKHSGNLSLSPNQPEN